MVDTGPLMNDSPCSPLGKRRKNLEKWLSYAIEQGWKNFTPPDGGSINSLDIKLLEPFARSCGLEISQFGDKGVNFFLSTKKIEEEPWAEDLLPKRNWFIRVVNRFLYWINK